jgi:hypothetical protein
MLTAVAVSAAPAPNDGVTLLSGDSLWRLHVTLRKPVIPGKDGAAEAIIKVAVPYRSYPGIEKIETPLPPDGWMAPEFDDAGWARGFGVSSKNAGAKRSIEPMLSQPGTRFSTGLLCLRGKFSVSDPTAITGLSLKLGYRGGVVVYLNGQEVGRQDLPGKERSFTAPGAPYPEDAWLDANGKLLPGFFNAGQRIAKGEPDLSVRLLKRDRSMGPLEISRQAIRKGVNVLAIEIHRSEYPASAAQKDFMETGWTPCALLDVDLKVSGTGVEPSTFRPSGLQVWNQDINDRTGAGDFGDPLETLRPILMVGARNGSFSGKVVVSSTQAMTELKAMAGDLKAVAGAGVIPAAQLQVRWGLLDGEPYKKKAEWFDGLATQAPDKVPVVRAGVATQPVLLTVRVPQNAPAGEYRGNLTISAQGAAAVQVPVILHVSDWTLPDPRAFRTYVGVYQSPTTLALQYGVPEWSEKHWQLMEKSFALLAALGNKIVNIPIVDRTQFGNDEGMVTWVRQADGSFTYDLTVLDRFLDLTEKHLGVPDVVALQIWHSGGWEARKASQENTVTVLDPKSGQKSHMQVPAFDTEESKKFWRPLLDQIRERLARKHMEKSMAIGILSDGTAPAEVFQAFDAIVPGGANWTRGCHSVTRATEPYPASKLGGKVMLHEFCYGMSIADPDAGLPTIWKQRTWPGTAYVRHNFDDTLSLLKYRTFAERALFCGTRGIGRTCLDFWASVKTDKGGDIRVFNRYPFSSCGQREPNLWRLSWPGPEGAEPTLRLQQMIEGIQMAEALIVVAEAQGEKAQAEAIGADLAAQCRQIFIDRLNYARRHASGQYGVVSYGTVHLGWQELDRRVLDLAARVQKIKPM